MADRIVTADDESLVRRCFVVMRELRPHIASADDFLARVKRQEAQGYRLVYLESEGEIRAVGGFRFLENLFYGRVLYVDDLVTRESDRSRGYGERLFAWLVETGRAQNCATLELDSGVQRSDAHRFYLRHRMDISSFHFRLRLEETRRD